MTRYNNTDYPSDFAMQEAMWKDMGYVQSDRGNWYDMRGDFGIGYTVNRHLPFYFDKEDFDEVSKYKWSDDYCKHLNCKNGKPQYFCVLTHDVKPKIRLHEVVTGKKHQDHKNHNTFDCRKCNLRDVTAQQNSWNTTPRHIGESGIAGVHRKYPDGGPWVGKFRDAYIETYDLDEAKKFVLEARVKHRGEYDYHYPQFEEMGGNLDELRSRPDISPSKTSLF